MDHSETGNFLRDGFLLLAFALPAVLLFRRLGLGATLGYIVAGSLVGPHVFGLVGDAEEMIGFAELGIVLLLFVVGLELKPERLVADEARYSRARAAAGRAVRAGDRRADLLVPRFLPPPRWCSGCHWLCRRPRRCCRCCNRPGGCARRSASGRSRSCCSRTSR
jgi:hypothetical protein